MAIHSLADLAEIAELVGRNTGDRPVWLRVGRLFDGSGYDVLADAHLVFDPLRIRHVGRADDPPSSSVLGPQQTGPDLELPDFTVLPGLIEAHAHLFLDGDPVDHQVRQQYLQLDAGQLLKQAKPRWERLIQCGVLAVRDAGDKDGIGLAMAADCRAAGGQVSTTGYLDSPGAAIHHQKRYGSFMSRPLEEFDSPAACVQDRIHAGAHRIKLIATGIINFKAGKVTAPPQMEVEELKAFVDAARAHGKQTFAHASGTDGVQNVIDSGVTTVEHGYFVTHDQLSQMRDQNIGWVPTIAPVRIQFDRADDMGWNEEIQSHLRRIVEDHQKMLIHAQQIGVPVIAGSDAGSCGVPHGYGFLRELELMQDSGMTAIEVLRSATGRGAEMLDFHEPIGRISDGSRSRFLLTPHNPLSDVGELWLPKIIALDGGSTVVGRLSG